MTGYNFYLAEKLGELHREERLREAEMARLARQIHPKRTSRLGAAFVWLGRQMVQWGTRLQNDYGPPIQVIGEPNGASC